MKRTEIIRRLTSTLDRKPKVTEINVPVSWLRTLMEDPATESTAAEPTAASEPPKKTRTRRKPAESTS